MKNAKELMIDIYNTLVQIRYPKITTAVAETVELTILNGENRLSLLSWLLVEKSPLIAPKLQKLKGAALEAELLKCYSEIGICTDIKLLLGNCSLEEQLPTLSLILDFIKCVFIESSDIKQSKQNSINDMLNVYINEDPNIDTCNVEPQLSYVESMQYFDNLQKYLNEYKESSHNCEFEKKGCLEEHLLEDKKEESNEMNRDLLLNEEIKKFIEAFSSITSWSMFNTKNVKNNLHSMDTDINDIYSNFSSLMQFLQAKEEIFNIDIPKEIDKLNTPLSEIVENTVTLTEEARNLCICNY